MPILATFVQARFAAPGPCRAAPDGWVTIAATVDVAAARRAAHEARRALAGRVIDVRILKEADLLVERGPAGVAEAYRSLLAYSEQQGG